MGFPLINPSPKKFLVSSESLDAEIDIWFLCHLLKACFSSRGLNMCHLLLEVCYFF